MGSGGCWRQEELLLLLTGKQSGERMGSEGFWRQEKLLLLLTGKQSGERMGLGGFWRQEDSQRRHTMGSEGRSYGL